MKKVLLTAALTFVICFASFSQNFISGVVGLYGDNTLSGNTTVARSGSLYFNNSTLYSQRSFINRGDSTAIIADSGTLVLSGRAAQAITGRFRISALQINNPRSNAQIVDNVFPTMVTILDSVTFGNVNNSVFDAGDSLLTLRSNVQKTARIADLTHNDVNSGNAIGGRVIAERYLRSRRAWRLLCPPTTADSVNDQTISEAWQEGARAPRGQIVDPNPGYGTLITRSASNPPEATGYDDGVGTFSLHSYASNGLYNIPPNTDLTHFSSNAAYFLFVRGDRSVPSERQTSTHETPSTITTLRSRGALHNGDVIDVVTNAAGGYAGVSNPYACTVDFSKVELNGVMNGFYTWDPSLNILGGWVYIDGTDNYNATPVTPAGVGVYTNPGTNALVQSGLAILVRTIGSTGTVTFKESNKNITNRVDVFRQVPLPTLNISLYSKDSSHTFLDGATTVFDASFSKSDLPYEDIHKPNNVNENLSFYADTGYLMKDKWPMPSAGDTLPLRLWRTSVSKYQFAIDMKYLAGAPQAYLLDKYLNTSAGIQAGTTTSYDFDITSSADSKAIDRFAIVFAKSILPVTLSQIKADWENDGVTVQWNVQNETGVAHYDVERSVDGIVFIKIGTVAAHGNNSLSDTYHFLDAQPASGENYYRVKSVDISGAYTFTSVVMVTVPDGIMSVTVYPNPVINHTAKLLFNYAPAGNYLFTLYSIDGKKIITKPISHPGGAASYKLNIGVVAQGLYHAIITSKENNKKIDIPLVVD